MNGEGRPDGLGVMSLRAAVAGFVLPVLASLAVLIWQPELDGGERYRFVVYLVVLFGGLELIALIAGLTSLDTRAGKLAVVLSLLLLLGAGGWYAGKKTGLLDGEAPPEERDLGPAEDLLPPPSEKPGPPPPPPTPPSPPPARRQPGEEHQPGELFPNVPAEG